MKIKEKPSRILFLIIDVIVLLLITYACLMPIWHMVMASISNPGADTRKGDMQHLLPITCAVNLGGVIQLLVHVT